MTIDQIECPYTDRQLAVMELVAAGYNSKVISNQMGIAEDTVRTHREHIIKKHGSTNMIDAIITALKKDWIHLYEIP